MRAAKLVVLCLLCVSASASPVPSKPGEAAESKSYLLPTRLIDSSPGLFESYGLSLAADADTLLVGAPAAFPNEKVAFYAREGNGWSLQQEFSPADGALGDFFGDSVAISGDLAVVGAPDQSSSSGAVYVLRLSNGSWVQEARLRANDAAGGARFGESVAVSTNTIAIGATGSSDRRGAVYVFVYSGGVWSQQARVQASDAARNDGLGGAVALSGDTLAAGATQGLSGGTGAAYVFTRQGSNWSQQARLSRTGGAASDFYGAAIALQADLLAVGAPFADLNGVNNAGMVEIWRRQAGTWTFSEVLTSNASSENAQLGASLALSGRRLAVGAPGDAVSGAPLRGSIEVFLQESDGGFEPNQRLTIAEGVSEDQLGFAVALGTNALAGSAPGETVSGQTYAGAVHAFTQLQTNTNVLPLAGQPVRIGTNYPVALTVSAPEGIPNGSVSVQDDQNNACTISLAGGSGACSLLASTVGPRRIDMRYDGGPGFSESFATATVQIQPDLRITPAMLADAQIGRPYSMALGSAATGATLPLAYAVVSGSLPAGLSLGAGGSLSGTPSEFGNFSFSIRLSDSSSVSLGGPFSETRSYSLQVQPPFTTSMALLAANTTGDRGQTLAVASQLEVIEAGAAAPVGNYVVTATNGARVISCSSPVSSEGVQSCSLVFATLDPVGDYSVVARFQSSNADYADSVSSGAHRLFAAADPAAAVEALDPTWTAGDNLRFALTLQNSGPDAALGLRVQFTVDAALQDLHWTCSGAACPTPSGEGAVDLMLASLPVGASLRFELAGTALETAAAAISATASLSLNTASFGRDLNLDNNSATASSLPLKIFGNGFEQPQD